MNALQYVLLGSVLLLAITGCDDRVVRVDDSENRLHRQKTSDESNAVRLLETKLSLCKESDRKLLLTFGNAEGCAWCKILEKFLDQSFALLEADFIRLRIDVAEMSEGKTVYDSYTDGSMLPWLAVLNSDGVKLAEMKGFPAEVEEQNSFVRILQSNAVRLSENDIRQFRGALSEYADSIRQHVQAGDKEWVVREYIHPK